MVVYLVPSAVLSANFTLVSASLGLLFSFVTNKMIVFSMARMTFATVQADIVPVLVVALASEGGGVTEKGVETLWRACALWQGGRVVWWSSMAIGQLCKRLKIRCFKIDY